MIQQKVEKGVPAVEGNRWSLFPWGPDTTVDTVYSTNLEVDAPNVGEGHEPVKDGGVVLVRDVERLPM